LAVVVNFDDARVVELFREVLQTSSESDVLRLAAQRIALDETSASRQFLRDRLLSERNALRVRCIAGVLARAADLSDAEKLRLVLAGSSRDAPSFPRGGHDSAQGWARELGGPFALHARRLLEASGRPSDLLALLPSWSSWAAADQAWFLSWGSTLFGSAQPPVAVCALLGEALSQSAKAVVLAALRWCAACPSAVPASALTPLAASADSELRLAAMSALPISALDWSRIARNDADPAIRAMAIERALSTSDVAGTADFGRLMEDSDWRVRAAIVRGLHGGGTAAVDSARTWLEHSNPQVRAGALRILMDHGQERWLADTLIG
jgi:hypothetical protein